MSQRVYKGIIDRLFWRHGVSRVVLDAICRSPFSFAANVIRDGDDERELMFHRFGKIRIKKALRGRKRELYDAHEQRLHDRLLKFKLKREGKLEDDK